ncbi:unnamed protein product [Nezara viridula]|uniref:OTU domain-containing protein n=1 Tax=Nezara viridula TaxID=85310 RepID=A0A9P0GWX8_NEZVI|nr:unnamed protein product [Nezara viridula]
MWKGVCLDEFCQQTLVFPECLAYVTCHFCGQTHPTTSLLMRAPIDLSLEENQHLLKCSVDKFNHPPKGPDLVKVMGLSHYHEKLISPLLSTYGMDKHTGKAVLLRLLTGRANLDCSVFSDRSFMIEPHQVDICGFGKDRSANEYLAETLSTLLPFNNNQNNLVALHVDGDGHCLVHAISRAVMGRELFWHPLRVGLKQHFNTNLEKYKSVLGSWISNQEWGNIIEECDPTYSPPDGSMVGLRNIHVFGLANLLRRPIILIDCLQGMKASADYAAIFLPGLNPPMACRDKSGRLNTPLLLAWSSSARNHYVPVVPIKNDNQLPRIHRSFLPEVWGFPQSLTDTYIHFDEQNCFTLGGEGRLPQPYILKLTSAMDELFCLKNGVSPQLIADLYQFEFRGKARAGETAPWYDKLEEVIPACVAAFQEGRVVRCLYCAALSLLPIRGQWLRNGGVLYQAASKTHGFLTDGLEYAFRNNLYISSCFSFKYNSQLDLLVVHKIDSNSVCPFCQECSLRKVKDDGSVIYENGDRTLIPVSDPSKTRCGCGAKHFWGNKYYDNPPILFTLELNWNGIDLRERIVWFEGESDESLNSSLYDTAANIIRNKFSTSRCSSSTSNSPNSNLILDDYELSKLHDLIIGELLERTSSETKRLPENNKRQHPVEDYDAPRKKHSREDFSPQPSTSST